MPHNHPGTGVRLLSALYRWESCEVRCLSILTPAASLPAHDGSLRERRGGDSAGLGQVSGLWRDAGHLFPPRPHLPLLLPLALEERTGQGQPGARQ